MEHNVLRPRTARSMLKNPPDAASVMANGNCQGYQTFNNSNINDRNIQNAICPWKYECDFDPQRIPAVLFYDKCIDRTANVNSREYICKEVYYPVNTIRTSSCDPLHNSTQHWEWESVKQVPVACVAISAM